MEWKKYYKLDFEDIFRDCNKNIIVLKKGKLFYLKLDEYNNISYEKFSLYYYNEYIFSIHPCSLLSTDYIIFITRTELIFYSVIKSSILFKESLEKFNSSSDPKNIKINWIDSNFLYSKDNQSFFYVQLTDKINNKFKIKEITPERYLSLLPDENTLYDEFKLKDDHYSLTSKYFTGVDIEIKSKNDEKFLDMIIENDVITILANLGVYRYYPKERKFIYNLFVKNRKPNRVSIGFILNEQLQLIIKSSDEYYLFERHDKIKEIENINKEFLDRYLWSDKKNSNYLTIYQENESESSSLEFYLYLHKIIAKKIPLLKDCEENEEFCLKYHNLKEFKRMIEIFIGKIKPIKEDHSILDHFHLKYLYD